MCIISFKTLTAAQMAARILRDASVYSEVTEIDPHLTRRGCSYGVTFNSAFKDRALRILNGKGIPYGEVFDGA